MIQEFFFFLPLPISAPTHGPSRHSQCPHLPRGNQGIMQWCSGEFPASPLQDEKRDVDFFPGQLHFVLSQSWGRGRSWGKHSAADASICRLPHFLKGSLWEKAISSESPRFEGWGNFLPEWLEVFTFVINRSMLTENTKPNADIWSFWKFPVKHGWIYNIFPTNSTHGEGKWLQISGNGLFNNLMQLSATLPLWRAGLSEMENCFTHSLYYSYRLL